MITLKVFCVQKILYADKCKYIDFRNIINFQIHCLFLAAGLPAALNDFHTLCLSPVSLRKSLNVRVNPEPRILKKGCFLNLLRYFFKIMMKIILLISLLAL